MREQVEGRSLLPLLEGPEGRVAGPHARHARRPLGTGQGGASKYVNCSIRNSRFTLVNNARALRPRGRSGRDEERDRRAPGRRRADSATAYDRWWQSVLPALENEDVTGPKVNPFKALYWKQFGGGPDEELRKRMDPDSARPKGTGRAARPARKVGAGRDARTAHGRPNIVSILADDLPL